MLWFKVPPKIYFKRGATDLALREFEGKKRAFIITDRFLFDSGAVRKITDVLEEIDIDYQIFFDVKPDPTLSTAKTALAMVGAARNKQAGAHAGAVGNVTVLDRSIVHGKNPPSDVVCGK